MNRLLLLTQTKLYTFGENKTIKWIYFCQRMILHICFVSYVKS